MKELSEMELLLYKWKKKLLTEQDRKKLIGKLKADAEKRWKRDRWGAMVEFGLIYQLKKRNEK